MTAGGGRTAPAPSWPWRLPGGRVSRPRSCANPAARLTPPAAHARTARVARAPTLRPQFTCRASRPVPALSCRRPETAHRNWGLALSRTGLRAGHRQRDSCANRPVPLTGWRRRGGRGTGASVRPPPPRLDAGRRRPRKTRLCVPHQPDPGDQLSATGADGARRRTSRYATIATLTTRAPTFNRVALFVNSHTSGISNSEVASTVSHSAHRRRFHRP